MHNCPDCGKSCTCVGNDALEVPEDDPDFHCIHYQTEDCDADE